MDKNFLFTVPKELPDGYTQYAQLSIPFGPLVSWIKITEAPCTFCSGHGDVDVTGDDYSILTVECPSCDGAGTTENAYDYNAGIIYSIGDGTIIHPVEDSFGVING